LGILLDQPLVHGVIESLDVAGRSDGLKLKTQTRQTAQCV
jgi:hypothetical protein